MDDVQERVRAALSAGHADRTVKELASETELSEAAVRKALAELDATGRAVTYAKGIWLSDVALQRLRATARRHIAAFHRRQPFEIAMPVGALAPLLEKAASVRDLPAALAYLETLGELVIEEAAVRLPDHEVTLPPKWQQAADDLCLALRRYGFMPPPPAVLQREFPRDIHVPTILRVLVEQGKVIPVAEDQFYVPATIVHAHEILRRLSDSGQEITVATFRDATDSTRKYSVALLEYFDFTGFTRNTGERRVLAGPNDRGR